MKKYRILVLIIILIISTLILNFLKEPKEIKIKEHFFRKVEIKRENTIVNNTDKQYLDTIVATGLKKLNIKNTYVVIKKLNPNRKFEYGYDLNGYVRNKGKQYFVFIKDTTREESIRIIAHELIHYKQYYDKRLSLIGNTIIWENKKYPNNLAYALRPWEPEAYNNGAILEQEIKKELY
ncbi:MAG TPA: hypothetical protein VIV55_00545 [Flavobacterium sp.]